MHRVTRRDQARQRSREAVSRRMAGVSPRQWPYVITCGYAVELAWNVTNANWIARDISREHRCTVLIQNEGNGYHRFVDPEFVPIRRNFLQKVDWKKEGF